MRLAIIPVVLLALVILLVVSSGHQPTLTIDLLSSYIVGKSSLEDVAKKLGVSTDKAFTILDVNGDGRVNALDITALERKRLR